MLSPSTQKWSRKSQRMSNSVVDRSFSALIWRLGGIFKIIARFAGLITFFAETFQPESCPSQTVSPGIPASQQVFLKQGGLSDRVSRCRSGFPTTLGRTGVAPESFHRKFADAFFSDARSASPPRFCLPPWRQVLPRFHELAVRPQQRFLIVLRTASPSHQHT